MNDVFAKIEERVAQEQSSQRSKKCRLHVCNSTGCISSGSVPVQESLAEGLKSHGLEEHVSIVPTGCMGLCSHGPLVRVEHDADSERGDLLFESVDADLATNIVDRYVQHHVGGATQLEVDGSMRQNQLPLDIPFFTRQTKFVLGRTGWIDPERIEEYLAAGGYRGLRRVLFEMTPEEVIDELLQSKLRGRGGAGFPTGLKWKLTRQQNAPEKIVICNGDEGDPGAYMDRSILEGDPHAVIEGMLIAGYAMGASAGFFYIRAEYQLAVERVDKAIKQARRAGVIGKSVLGTNFSFDIEIRLGAGAFVCGEETALIASIEGRRGTPSPRPPYPSVRGLWDAPSCINNVETLANVPLILERGAGWFTSAGTPESPGTKVFALTGNVRNSGLVEVPMGITLREIVLDIGGGSGSKRKVKAVQTGGPSGGVIPEKLFDTAVTFEHLAELGSIMGSGGLIVLDEADSMVDIAKFYLGFCVDESCGKCAPCRIGGKQMLHILERLSDGNGKLADLELLRKTSHAMQVASLCGLGQTAPNPVLSTLRYFEDEYRMRIADVV